MPAAPLPDREHERLAALRATQLLDTPPEKAFDDLARVAARLFDVPIALVSLVDDERQWFKARFGLDVCETPRAQAFCAWAVREPDQVLVVEDAETDPRFADNPLVTGEPGIRFYAGAPLVDSAGHALGTLCVIDTRVRTVTPELVEALAALARQVTARIEHRSALRELSVANERLLSAEAGLRARNEHLALIERMGKIVMTESCPSETVERVLELCREHLGATEAVLVALEEATDGGHVLREVTHGGAARELCDERERWGAWLAQGPLGPLRSDDDGRRTWVSMGFAREGEDGGAVLLRCEPGRCLESQEVELLRSFVVRLGIFHERATIERERQRDAALLVESEQRFRNLTDHSPVMMWMGGPDGGCVHVNQSWLEFTGRRLEDEVGGGWLERVHEDDRERLATTFRRAFEARAPFACEFRIPRADGELRWVLTAGRARIDEAGEFQGYMGSCLDITERVRGERAARTSRDRALESARNQARFLADLGRELRAPLHGLVGALDLTLADACAADAQDLLGLARGSCDALLGRLDLVAELSRVEAERAPPARVPYDLGVAVAEALEALQGTARARDVALTLECAPELPSGQLGDGACLRRALGALLTHALASAVGSRLTLRVARGGSGRLAFRLCAPQRPSDAAERGGDPLALALARALLERMGSELRDGVAREELFTFELDDVPAEEPESALPARIEARGLADGLGRSALVVGGDDLGREVLARMLRVRRFEVEVVADGLAALARRRAGASFDAILIDADGPSVDGPEAARRLRALEREHGDVRTPLVGLTAAAGPEERRRWLDAGADVCLHKPVGLAELDGVLAEWVLGLGCAFDFGALPGLD